MAISTYPSITLNVNGLKASIKDTKKGEEKT